jgi:hypothetical protein
MFILKNENAQKESNNIVFMETFVLFIFFNLSTLSVPHEDHSRNTSASLI